MQTIDLMPTVLELAGLPVPEAIQGQSLVPLFAGDEPRLSSRPAITEAANDDGTKMTSLIADGWKIVRIDDPAPETKTRYDHGEDPLSLHDVVADHPEIVDRLSEQIEAWQSFAVAEKLVDAKAAEQMDSAELERLKSWATRNSTAPSIEGRLSTQSSLSESRASASLRLLASRDLSGKPSLDGSRQPPSLLVSIGAITCA